MDLDELRHYIDPPSLYGKYTINILGNTNKLQIKMKMYPLGWHPCFDKLLPEDINQVSDIVTTNFTNQLPTEDPTQQNPADKVATLLNYFYS
jgi:hypothetical protein